MNMTRSDMAVAVAALFVRAAVLSGAETAAPAAAGPCPIVPTPKEYRETGRLVRIASAADAVIVVGSRATDQERYAAQRLQCLVKTRFGIELRIAAETDNLRNARVSVLLGQRGTHDRLDRICREKGIELGADSPGCDGFVIEVSGDGERDSVLVGGVNPRGVIYGQDAFFDLLRREGEGVAFPAVSVRDWATIAWRGRGIWDSLPSYLDPGKLDAYVRARFNLIDIRGNGFGLIPGAALDHVVVENILTEAHRRGFFVYGTVQSGLRPGANPVAHRETVLKTFRELIDLGVDGLWVSFDDVGAGPGTEDLIRAALELGAEHNMRGRCIATTPPAGSYGSVDTEFNRSAAKIPGFDAATWFFTIVPNESTTAGAKQIGLKSLPAWWHNWPRVRGGFLHSSYTGDSLRAVPLPPYLNLHPLTTGWGLPNYEHLKNAAKYTDTAIFWKGAGKLPDEYLSGTLGIWAWNPAGHDWAATRLTIYAYVFGPTQAEAALAFDDALARLKDLFLRPDFHAPPGTPKDTIPVWPCRLIRVEDRPQAVQMLDEMEAALKTLAERAPKESVLDRERLATLYLEPMRATVDFARKMATIDYPEYHRAEFGQKILALLEAGKTAEAEQELTALRERVVDQARSIAEQLRGLRNLEGYAGGWERRLSGLHEFCADARPKYITHWHQLGPLLDPEDWNEDTIPSLETDFQKGLEYPGARGPQKWRVVEADKASQCLRLPDQTRALKGALFLMTFLESGTPGACRLYVGPGTTRGTIFLNGGQVGPLKGAAQPRDAPQVYELNLRQGANCVIWAGESKSYPSRGLSFLLSDLRNVVKVLPGPPWAPDAYRSISRRKSCV